MDMAQVLEQQAQDIKKQAGIIAEQAETIKQQAEALAQRGFALKRAEEKWLVKRKKAVAKANNWQGYNLYPSCRGIS